MNRWGWYSDTASSLQTGYLTWAAQSLMLSDSEETSFVHVTHFGVCPAMRPFKTDAFLLATQAHHEPKCICAPLCVHIYRVLLD